MQSLDKRVQDLERKVETEPPIVFRLVMHGEPTTPGVEVIHLTWGDEPDQVQPEGGDDAQQL